jgi:hypothetical protein
MRSRRTDRERLSKREMVLGVVFVFSTLVVAAFVLDRQRPNAQFWVCCVLSVLSLGFLRRKLVFLSALFAFAATRFAFALVVAPRWEALVGFAVCGAVCWWLVRTFPDM